MSWSKATRRVAAGVGALVLAAVAPACSSSTSTASSHRPSYERITKPQLVSGEAIPKPTGRVVLSISGRISHPNVGRRLDLDLATLERLGLVQYRSDDYQAEGHHVTFRGVLLDRLLAVAGMRPGSRTLHLGALNDYKADLPVSDTQRYPVLVATSVDGHRMSVARYGPIRVVYPNLDFSFAKSTYDARWVWQLRSIDVA